MSVESAAPASATADNSVPLPDALGPLSPSPAPVAEDPVATEVAAVEESSSNPTEPVAGTSGTAPIISGGIGEDFSAILGIDVNELPEGVDPSFLAALPEDMRQEVIDEQRRLQTIRQRAAQNTEAGITEVNAEFLAALPPNIQEEVLAQQRIEQQRQAAAANPGNGNNYRTFILIFILPKAYFTTFMCLPKSVSHLQL
jgi:E3 ubiquitin-protein ligase HUWE1